MQSFTCNKTQNGNTCESCELHVLASKVYGREKELREFPVEDDIIMTAYQDVLCTKIEAHRKQFNCERYNVIDTREKLIDHVINGDLPPQGIEVIPEITLYASGQSQPRFCTRVNENI